MSFKKAEKIGIRLRLALCGPTGSGKTYWALEIAKLLAKHYQTRAAFIDSERGSAKKYADRFDFDVLELASYEPERYIDAIAEAEKNGYGVVIVDSLSHAWEGKGGVLERVDTVAKKQTRPNSYTAWREGTKAQNDLVDSLLDFAGQEIVTLRTKMAYEQGKDERGKMTVTKVGLQPVQRDGLEYEFDIVCDINQEHELMIGKTRCAELDGKVFRKHEADKFVGIVIAWLGDQSTVEDKKPADVPKATERQTIINRIVAGEPKVYEFAPAISKAREKYVGTAKLEDASDEKLQAYLDHIIAKWNEKKGAA